MFITGSQNDKSALADRHIDDASENMINVLINNITMYLQREHRIKRNIYISQTYSRDRDGAF